MTPTDLKTRTVRDLANLAKKQKVPGWHAMRKDELVKALLKQVRSKLSSREKPKEYDVDKMMSCDVWVNPEIVVEIRADERLDVVALGVDVGDAAVIRLHLRKTAPIERIEVVGVANPSRAKELDVFEMVDHPIGVLADRIEHFVRHEMVCADFHAINIASVLVFAGQEVLDVAVTA